LSSARSRRRFAPALPASCPRFAIPSCEPHGTPHGGTDMKFPMLKRVFTTAAVAIAILLPITMIKGKIGERQARANDVVTQFAAETSGAQVIAGPFIALSCEESVVRE